MPAGPCWGLLVAFEFSACLGSQFSSKSCERGQEVVSGVISGFAGCLYCRLQGRSVVVVLFGLDCRSHLGKMWISQAWLVVVLGLLPVC